MNRKFPLIIIYALLVVSCSNQTQTTTLPSGEDTSKSMQANSSENPVTNREWQISFGLTHDPEKDSVWGKPVSYYINNPECIELARKFYYGKMTPTDDDSTAILLAQSSSENKELRPFYRWCLDRTIDIQDGALGEYTGLPAREYLQNYPKEFIEFIDHDKSGNTLSNWIDAISYSGFYMEDDYKDTVAIKARIIKEIKLNCKDCSAIQMARLDSIVTVLYRL